MPRLPTEPIPQLRPRLKDKPAGLLLDPRLQGRRVRKQERLVWELHRPPVPRGPVRWDDGLGTRVLREP